MTVLDVIQRSTDFLSRKGVESPRLQVELLLAHVLQMPRMKLYLNYSLDAIFYARTASENNNTQSSLNATFNYRGPDDFFFVDALANISQQAILPFGPAPSGDLGTSSTATRRPARLTRDQNDSPVICRRKKLSERPTLSVILPRSFGPSVAQSRCMMCTRS